MNQLDEKRQFLTRVTGEALLFILCTVPGLVFSFKSLQEPWTMFRIARASLSLQGQHVVSFVTTAAGYRSEHIGGEMVQIALLDATGWSLESLGLIPIGSLLLALLYYATIRTLGRSRWTAVAITLYASWYYPRLFSQFGSQTYAWTNILFLSFLILFFYWLRDKTPVLSMLIMFVFTATFLHYHTTPIWIVAATVTAVSATKLKTKLKILQAKSSWALPLFCSVLYLEFDTVMYGNALARLSTEAPNESFVQSFVTKIITPLVSRQPSTLNTFEIAPTNPRIATWTTLLVLLLLTIPVGLWCVIKVYKAVRSRNLALLVHTRDDTFIWTIILVALSHALIYSMYGAISLRVIPLAFPLILPLVAQEFGLTARLEPLLPWALAVLAIAGFISYAPSLLPDAIASETGLASRLIRGDSRLMGAPDVYGSLLLNKAESGQVIDFVWLDSEKYASMVGQQPVNQDDFDYVAVDTSDKPITSSNWSFYEPWTQHLLEINQNSDLNKIYDSEHLMIFQPREAELPSYRLVSRDVTASREPSLLDDVLWAFLATISLIFVPGAVLVFMVHNRSVFWIGDTYILIGVIVGLSIAFVTFVGYITNFTPLGLSWFVPLSATVPWVILGIYLVIYRPRLQFNWSHVVFSLSLVFILLIWSLLSAGVAHARTERHSEFTELFVARDPQSGSLTVNVVSKLNQFEEFTLAFKAGDVEVHTIGPRPLAPNSWWTENWEIPPTLPHERLVIVLEKGGVPYRELQLSNPASLLTARHEQGD